MMLIPMNINMYQSLAYVVVVYIFHRSIVPFLMFTKVFVDWLYKNCMRFAQNTTVLSRDLKMKENKLISSASEIHI